MPSLSHMMIRNAIVSGGARIFTLLIGMIITPYLLVNLGAERFGIWALLAVVTGIAALGDFSFKTSLIKHLSAAWAAGETSTYNAITSNGFFFCCGNALALGVVLLWNIDLLLIIFNIPESLRNEAQLTFIIGVGAQLISIGLTIFPALCDARQRLDVTNGLGMLSLVVGTLLTVVAIEGNYGLTGVALAQLAAISLFHLSTVVCARVLFGSFGISYRLISIKNLRTLLSFGLTLHLSTICGIINRQFDKFLLSRWAGLGWVASYELALKWVGSAGSLQPYVAATMLPAGSQLSAIGDLQQLRSLYFAAYRYLFLIGLPPFFFLFAHADSIITVWIGQSNPAAASMIIILSIGYLANSLSNGMAYVCQGIGRPDIQATQSVIQLLINIGLSISLYLLIGPLGAAIGTSLALLIGTWIYAALFHRYFKISTVLLLKRTALIPSLAALAAAFVSYFLTTGNGAINRIDLFLQLLVAGCVFLLVFLLICFASNHITFKDFSKLLSIAYHLKEGNK